MVSISSGFVGGFVATIVMTIFMMSFGDDSPPPTALFWSKYVDDGAPNQYMMQGMVLHMVYGIIAGGVFAASISTLGFASVVSLSSALLWGLIYGVILFVGAAVFWMNIVLGMEPEMKMAGMFLFFHLVYGAVLGIWLKYGILG